MKPSLPPDFEPRAQCTRCERPTRVCYCEHLTSIPTQTRVVLLQHPREEDMAIGTARMAHLCLPNSELHVGINFEDSNALARALSDPERPAALLYPGDDAIDIFDHPPEGPITLVVVDGTWWQAKKLVRTNEALRRLPRYAFRAPKPSEYRIRREPDETYVSTIEALTHVLSVLEDSKERIEPLLRPFRAMIDMQIEFATNVRERRVRHIKTPTEKKRTRLPSVLAEQPERIVCVTAEANAWPYRNEALRTTHREELVHWIAHRPATGDLLDVIVRPRNPLAPSTPAHIGLPADTLMNGDSLETLFEAWSAFTREDDVICSWGHYPTGIFQDAGGALPPVRFDLRQLARTVTRGRVGTMDVLLERMALASQPLAPLGRGRAGLRAAQLSRILNAYKAIS